MESRDFRTAQSSYKIPNTFLNDIRVEEDKKIPVPLTIQISDSSPKNEKNVESSPE